LNLVIHSHPGKVSDVMQAFYTFLGRDWIGIDVTQLATAQHRK